MWVTAPKRIPDEHLNEYMGLTAAMGNPRTVPSDDCFYHEQAYALKFGHALESCMVYDVLTMYMWLHLVPLTIQVSKVVCLRIVSSCE